MTAPPARLTGGNNANLTAPRRRPTMSGRERRHLIMGLLFTMPWIVGFLAFSVYPLLMSVYYSLTVYDGLRPPLFIGLGNYVEMAHDPVFINGLGNTIFYTVFAVPGGVVVGLGLALLLNQKLPLRSGLRTVFYLPSVVPQFVSAMVWLWIYNKQYGLFNSILYSMGMPGAPWLASPTWSKPSLIIMSLWASGTAMVIFLAALQDVPRELYEAARIDGATAVREFFNITIPMVTPAILFTLLIGLIGALQYFTPAWIMTRGGPVRSTEFYGLLLYQYAFVFFRMGYASAMAWLLFFVTVTVAVLVFRTSARWVYYPSERL